MKNRFYAFIEKIPKNIHNNTKTFLGKKIAVFIPETYIFDKCMICKDYHFVIFHTTPPYAIINNENYILKRNTLLCLSPGSEIAVKSKRTKAQAKYVAININSEFFENIIYKISGSKKIKSVLYDCQYSYKILNLLEFFMQEFIYTDEPSEVMIESIETQIVIQLLRDMDLDPTVNKSNFSQENSYVGQAIKIIESYYNSNITINEICNAIYLSPCHFQRIFKNVTNKTPHQYLTEYRIIKSKEKLKSQDISIAEIAKLCGFLSGGHFSTVFKKYEGITPSKYRNILKL